MDEPRSSCETTVPGVTDSIKEQNEDHTVVVRNNYEKVRDLDQSEGKDEEDKAIDIYDEQDDLYNSVIEEDEYGDEEIDPRIQEELETLNTASNEINILEKELDEARALFRQFLTDATHSLRSLANHLGQCIDKARPYFEAREQAKKFPIMFATLFWCLEYRRRFFVRSQRKMLEFIRSKKQNTL